MFAKVCARAFLKDDNNGRKRKRAEREERVNLKAIHKWKTIAIAIATYAYLNAEL